MKLLAWIPVLLVFGAGIATRAQTQPQIPSEVYAWQDAPLEKTDTGSKRTLVKGNATDFEFMDITAVTLDKGKGESESPNMDFEEMVVVKDGRLSITLSGESKTVGRGSVAILMPGDKRSYTNAAAGETTFYVLRYKSKKPVDAERGMKSGGSFVVDWNNVKFTARNDGKGGTRNFFNKPTAMGRRLELHSTQLNSTQNSHAPHRHRAEELVIILEADVEMYLGPGATDGKTRKATDGDIIYLVSNEYHAISNIGTKPALYFAFQFE